MLLITNESSFGTQQYRLNLNLLYPDPQDRDEFEVRWSKSPFSDKTQPCVYWRTECDTLTYQSESFIPTAVDDRPALLLLLGNPASHSMLAGMCFAFEGEDKEHRFWIGLRNAGLLDYCDAAADGIFRPSECNGPRKERLRTLDYISPFRIGITMYYTLPSPASGSAWSGVAGLRKLFGWQALDRIAEVEQQRIAQIVQSFIPGRGGVMVFQRDAYEAVRGLADPPYSFGMAMAGKLCGTYRVNPAVPIVGVAPTKNMYSGKVVDSLMRYAKYIEAPARA